MLIFLRRLGRRAGVEKVKVHRFRHTFATWAIENEAWEWLWENTEYSPKEFMEKSALSLSETGFERRLAPLVGTRVLYPDGTVNSFVQRYLRERVLRLFDARPRKPTKGA